MQTGFMQAVAPQLNAVANLLKVNKQSNSTIIKLKGLPYTTTKEDILQFFDGYTVIDVEFVKEPDGRPSGLAFARFATVEEAVKALGKNGMYIGQRFIKLLHVTQKEMEEQVKYGTLAIPGAAAKQQLRQLQGLQVQGWLQGMMVKPPAAASLHGMGMGMVKQQPMQLQTLAPSWPANAALQGAPMPWPMPECSMSASGQPLSQAGLHGGAQAVQLTAW